jgi:hypothetical protein
MQYQCYETASFATFEIRRIKVRLPIVYIPIVYCKYRKILTNLGVSRFIIFSMKTTSYPQTWQC